jgi:hypothetical protein
MKNGFQQRRVYKFIKEVFKKRVPEVITVGLVKKGNSTANKREEKEGGIKSRMLFLYNENNLGQ